jgi:hypothetical protein
VKFAEEVMEILEAFDLVGTLRGAAALANCDHHTVAHYVEEREAAGGSWRRKDRKRPRSGAYAEKVAELVDRSQGKVRADKVHERLVAMGYEGSERTTRRAVARAKTAWQAGKRRVLAPWVPEPGLWLLCGKPHRSHYPWVVARDESRPVSFDLPPPEMLQTDSFSKRSVPDRSRGDVTSIGVGFGLRRAPRAAARESGR